MIKLLYKKVLFTTCNLICEFNYHGMTQTYPFEMYEGILMLHLANNYNDLLDLYVVSFFMSTCQKKISQQLVAQKSNFYIVLMSPTAIYLSA